MNMSVIINSKNILWFVLFIDAHVYVKDSNGRSLMQW